MSAPNAPDSAAPAVATDPAALDKAWSPRDVEARWYTTWEQRGYFHAPADSPKPPYTIVIPPPNVTGALHMGHALTLTVQDILIRWKRMSGFNACWLPGTDHAGIATQMVVERELAKEKLSRHDLGREKFLERVWQWKAQSGGRISVQTRALGASLDWERERFTMDAGLSVAVREAFVRLHEDGLIYRAHRLINWCSRCITALSDLETEHKDTNGSLWQIAYPVAGGFETAAGAQSAAAERLVVATTRPETLLGDTAVAVHPEDERYKHLVGQEVLLPIVNRRIPVIADESVDRAFGTGVVKITPAHDFNDFETGQRHKLPAISIFDERGKLNADAKVFVGVDRQEARKLVLAKLAEDGLLVGEQPHKNAVGHCQRCATVVEPRLSWQWFVRAEPLAKPAIEAVESGRTQIIPEAWSKTYFHWMRNIKDWCISRQLWWGHRIPAWYCDDCGGVTVARQDPTACGQCKSGKLRQDEDVLDTWFSSGLWPFSTFGWPEKTPDLAKFYPGDVLETGFDILFFWVARMMMMGIKCMGDVPFRTVYLHSLVRDVRGQKMSKTKGNVIDPLDVVQEHGADALRFTLALLCGQGRDIKLSVDRVVTNRNFVNKLWNASRFARMNLEGWSASPVSAHTRDLGVADRWVLSQLARTTGEVVTALESYEFNRAAQTLYQFTWNVLCDWYIELSKESLRGDRGAAAQAAARATLVHVLDHTLRLLHPFIPFVTEEIWQKLPIADRPTDSLMIAPYPAASPAGVDEAIERDVKLLVDAVTAVRTVRGESGISPGVALDVTIQSSDPYAREYLTRVAADITKLARTKSLVVEAPGPRPPKSAAVVLPPLEIYVPLEGIVDLDAERARIGRELKKAETDLAVVDGKLGNASFVDKAPADVVDEMRERQAELGETRDKLRAHLERFAG